jgi:hypothetical protein
VPRGSCPRNRGWRPPAELRRGARAAAAVSAGSHVVLSTAVAPRGSRRPWRSGVGGDESGGDEIGGDESGGDERKGEEEGAVTGGLLPADGIAADDDEVVP